MSSWIDDLTPAHVRALDVYQPGKPVEELERELGALLPPGGAVKVASNENPLGPSRRAVDAMKAALDGVNLYPDAGGVVLRRALAEVLGVGPERIILGGGSNELLYQLVLAFCEPDDEVVSHEAAFLSYRLSAQVAGRRFVGAKASSEKSVDVDALIACFGPKTKLVMLGTPNNPTGSIV
jgi:histidinol-phosphate aminotransferase